MTLLYTLVAFASSWPRLANKACGVGLELRRWTTHHACSSPLDYSRYSLRALKDCFRNCERADATEACPRRTQEVPKIRRETRVEPREGGHRGMVGIGATDELTSWPKAERQPPSERPFMVTGGAAGAGRLENPLPTGVTARACANSSRPRGASQKQASWRFETHRKCGPCATAARPSVLGFSPCVTGSKSRPPLELARNAIASIWFDASGRKLTLPSRSRRCPVTTPPH